MTEQFGEKINGTTFVMSVNQALATTYKINGKRCTAAEFWAAHKAAKAA